MVIETTEKRFEEDIESFFLSRQADIQKVPIHMTLNSVYM